MCIAMGKEEGATIPLHYLRNGFERNPDGGGYAFIDDNGLIVIRKGLMKWDEFIEAYEEDEYRYGETSPFLVHFRIGTHGTTSPENTHPHKIHNKMALIHNGIISGYSSWTSWGKYTVGIEDERSDTRLFIDDVLRFLPRGWLNNPGIMDLIDDRIGGSKFVILTNGEEYDTNLHIVGEAQGEWIDGVWYSNDSYKPKPKPKPVKAKVVTGPKGQEASTKDEQEPSEESPEYVDWWLSQAPTSVVDATVTMTCPLCTDSWQSGGDERLCPWCWDCLWCAICDAPVEDTDATGQLWDRACTCEGFKEHLDWQRWGPDYMEQIGGEVGEYRDAVLRHQPKSIHDMTDEEIIAELDH